MPRSIIELNHLSVRRGGQYILEDISAKIPAEKTTFILGPSGSGKSTLLKVVAGILPADEGSITINDLPLSTMSDTEMRRFRKMSGFVFADSALWANSTIYQNLSLPLRFHIRNISENDVSRRIEALLARLGFEGDTKMLPSDLSEGQRKLISVARALITDPQLIFMDAPTLSLDAQSSHRIADIVAELKKQNRSIIATTHDPGLTSMTADYLLVLNNGKLIEFGKLTDVVNSENQQVIEILTEVLSRISTFDVGILDLLDQSENILPELTPDDE